MRSLFYALFTGLAGAAVLHIVIILAVPQFTGRDARSRLTLAIPDNQFMLISDLPAEAGLVIDDPFVEAAVCSFDVSDKPVRIRAGGRVPFWSYVVYDGDNNEVFSMNDGSALAQGLDAIIASPAALHEIRKDNPDIASRSVLVELQRPDGYVVLRGLAPTQSDRSAIREFLSSAGCDPLG